MKFECPNCRKKTKLTEFTCSSCGMSAGNAVTPELARKFKNLKTTKTLILIIIAMVIFMIIPRLFFFIVDICELINSI